MILKLEQAIKTKLETIWDFQVVYDYFTLKTSWYPYASFELNWFEWDYLDSCTILRDYKFNLMILQEANQIEREQAKSIIYNLLDKTIQKFDWQMELWENMIVNWKIIKWEMWTFSNAEWTVLALNVEISLEFEQTMW